MYLIGHLCVFFRPLSVQTLLALFDLIIFAVVIVDLYRILDIHLLAYLETLTFYTSDVFLFTLWIVFFGAHRV